MADSSQKTEQPTAKRLNKAREDGDFPVSPQMVGALQFLGFVIILGSYTTLWFRELKVATVVLFKKAFEIEADTGSVIQLLQFAVHSVLAPVGVAFGSLFLLVFLCHLAMTNFGVSFKKMAVDFSKFNPMGRIKEIPSQGMSKVVESLAILILTGAVLYGLFTENVAKLSLLPFTRLENGTKIVADIMYGLLWKAAAVLLCFGTVDLFRQKQKYAKRLRMSRQEVGDELKEAEGNPHTKSRIRRLRRDLLRRRMMSAVPTSTVVIVNPTHFAVCIRYAHETMATPMVIAKGKNYLALRIRQIAIDNQIPLVENPPLAQSLYKSVEVGQEIPPLFYRAIAEVLAYVYQMVERSRHSGSHRRQ